MAGWEFACGATPLPHRLSSPTLAAVSSLWTPDGEHKVPRADDASTSSSGRPSSSASQPPGTPPSKTAPPGRGDDAADQPTEEELRRIARELAETPVEDIVVNHCYGLFELAALHLSQQPVNLPAARLAIDAMGHLVEGLGERLGPNAGALADGLTQLRLAFVRIADAASAAAAAAASQPGSGAGDGADPETASQDPEPASKDPEPASRGAESGASQADGEAGAAGGEDDPPRS